MDMQKKFDQLLKKQGLSKTKKRQFVFDFFLQQHEPISMNALVTATERIMNRTTTYRIVESFEKIGVLVRVQYGWKYKLELSDLFSHHHHHFSCQSCGQSIPFEEHDTIETSLHVLEATYGFRIDRHTLELVGLCSRCQHHA